MARLFVTFTAEPTQALIAFYERLGVSLHPEQHGRGPAHLSLPMDGSVLEFHPGPLGAPSVFIGIETDEDPATLKAELIARFGGQHAEDRPGSRACDLNDPAGHRVRLFPVRQRVS